MRWRRLLGCLLVVLAACSGPDDSPGPQAEAADTSPPGTALADGFVVPEGAALLGPLIPAAVLHGGSADAPGWTALLDIDEDPLVALEGLVRQAEAQGLSAHFSAACTAVSDARPECATCRDDGDSFRCHAILGGDGRAVYVHTVRDLDPPTDYALVQSFPQGLVATDDVWEPTVTDPVPEDPAPGQPVEVGDALVDWFSLVEGSTLLGPAIGSADFALVRIDNPDAEQGYIDQLLASSEELTEAKTVDHGGVRVRSTVGWVGAGGGDVATIAVSEAGQPTYMLLMRMED